MLSSRLSITLLFAATCVLMMSAVSTDSVTTCGNANDIQRLSCDSGVIRVKSALYGRLDSTTCSTGISEEQLSDTECLQEGTLQTLKKRCDGKMECEYTTDAVSDPDPCPDTYKYLQTNYTCLPAFIVTACEHSYAILFCDVGQEIYVYGADYGRRDQTTCSHGREASQVQDVTCSNPTPLIGESCNGRNSCMIRASNSVFGNPCSGIEKYLEVAYTCVYPATSRINEFEESFGEGW